MKVFSFSLAMAAVLLLSSCRGSDIWNGAEIVYTGEEIRYNEMSTFQWYVTRAISPGSLNEGIQVAALMPSCGCLTLTNLSENTVTLDATFHGERLGTIELGPDPSKVPSADPTGYQRTVKVDWGGASRGDIYILELYAEDNTTRIPQIRGIIDVGFVAGSCRNVACEVGALAMNRGERVIGASGMSSSKTARFCVWLPQ
jgi:hypothetical protein